MSRSLRTTIRLAAAAGFASGLVLLGATPAAADTTISINPGNVPTTAASAGTHECTQTPASPTLDGWVFVLPGNKGTFTSLTLTFATPGGPVVLTIPPSGSIINDNGTSKAFLQTPAGWTLTAATATVTGEARFFVLTHTCPATGTPSPSPSTSPPSSPPPSPSSSPPSSPVTALVNAASTPAGAGGLLLGAGALVAGALAFFRARRLRDREV